jgi:hypothetical protein
MVAVTVALCPGSEAQRAGGRDEARSQCQSEDTNKRLIGCTIVINAKGFGSKFELAAALDGRLGIQRFAAIRAWISGL